MPDVWATVAEQDEETQKRLAEVLETRGADPEQQELRNAFLDDIAFPGVATVLEVGCGTGVLTRRLAELPNVGEVVGVDVAGALLAVAAELASGLPNVSFTEADARALPFGDESFDAVVFDSTLTHVPGPDEALAEAFRVLRRRGLLAAFEGDYATTTVALGADDPLQACVDAMLSGSVHDRWIVRRLPRLVRACGFDVSRLRSFGYVDLDGSYMPTIVDRGVDVLHAAGQIADDAASALKAEARRRVETGTWFGHIAYASIVAVKP
jgi:ubiquinone/menaquinone biosynthesis C-methylase UbiE